MSDADRPRTAAPPRADPAIHRRRAVLPDGRRLVRRGVRPADRSDPARGADRHPGGRAEPRSARCGRRSAAGRGAVPALRPGAAQRDRAPPLAVPARAPAVQRTRPPGTGRAGGSPGRCRADHLAAAARPRPGRDGRGGVGSLRVDRRHRSAGGLPRAGRAPRRLGRAALHVLLRDERLAVDVRGRQRPRGRPRAVLRRPRGGRQGRADAGLVLRRGARREGRRPPATLG